MNVNSSGHALCVTKHKRANDEGSDRNHWPVARRTMHTRAGNLARWWTVVIFAMAMAWVEAAVVYYLRTLVDRINPYQADPLPIIGGLGAVELVREGATLVMLLAVGVLAGQSWRRRLGYWAVAFGVWDVSYYVFLRVMCGWPQSLFDWDVLFLLPLPWWGPVLAPVLIALLMVVWGTLASQCEQPQRNVSPQNWAWAWALNVAGIVLALYVFMADALRSAPQGVTAAASVLPRSFNWPVFAVALFLMAAPVVQLSWLCASEYVKRRLAKDATVF